MARINIEDEIHKDYRFFRLIEESFKKETQEQFSKLDFAYGALVRLWTLGQKWYLSPSKMIPINEWKKNLMPDVLIKTGWAIKEGDFIKVCGAEKQFAWLEQRVESGRRGGVARRGIRLPPEESARRQAARIMLSKAVKSGKIVRPSACEDCQKALPIQGHHSDYSKPYDVIWLCDVCHDRTHKIIEENLKQPQAIVKLDEAGAKPSSSSSSSTKYTLVDLPNGTPTSEDVNPDDTSQQLGKQPELITSTKIAKLKFDPASLWNEFANERLPRARGLTKKRMAAARERIKEHPEADDWIQAIKRISGSDF